MDELAIHKNIGVYGFSGLRKETGTGPKIGLLLPSGIAALAIRTHWSSVKDIKRIYLKFRITIYALRELGQNLRKDYCNHFDPSRLEGLATRNFATSRFFS